jgi:hypothetical protein
LKDAARILRGKLYNATKKEQNDGGKGTAKATGDQIDPHLKTAEIVAKQTGVSPATIKRDATAFSGNPYRLELRRQ